MASRAIGSWRFGFGGGPWSAGAAGAMRFVSDGIGDGSVGAGACSGAGGSGSTAAVSITGAAVTEGWGFGAGAVFWGGDGRKNIRPATAHPTATIGAANRRALFFMIAFYDGPVKPE